MLGKWLTERRAPGSQVNRISHGQKKKIKMETGQVLWKCCAKKQARLWSDSYSHHLDIFCLIRNLSEARSRAKYKTLPESTSAPDEYLGTSMGFFLQY